MDNLLLLSQCVGYTKPSTTELIDLGLDIEKLQGARTDFIKARFGMLDGKYRSYTELADLLNPDEPRSRERMRQLEETALGSLAEMARARGTKISNSVPKLKVNSGLPKLWKNGKQKHTDLG